MSCNQLRTSYGEESAQINHPVERRPEPLNSSIQVDRTQRPGCERKEQSSITGLHREAQSDTICVFDSLSVHPSEGERAQLACLRCQLLAPEYAVNAIYCAFKSWSVHLVHITHV